jgi:hypothetical protein
MGTQEAGAGSMTEARNAMEEVPSIGGRLKRRGPVCVGVRASSMSHLIVTGLTLRSRPHHHQTKGQHANTKVWRRDSARLTFGLGQKPHVRKVRFWRILLKKSAP